MAEGGFEEGWVGGMEQWKKRSSMGPIGIDSTLGIQGPELKRQIVYVLRCILGKLSVTNLGISSHKMKQGFTPQHRFGKIHRDKSVNGEFAHI